MTSPAGTTPTPTPQDIQAQYGFVTMLAQSVPEIGALLQQAVAQQWSVARFQQAVANTHWWKSTGDTARNWLVEQISDPATAQHQMQDGGNQITQMAENLGFSADQVGSQAQDIWLQGKLQGMTDAQLNGYITSRLWGQVTGNVAAGGVQGGQIGTDIEQMRQMAADYGYTSDNLNREITDATGNAVRSGQTGTDALSAWQQKMQNFALVKYAPFADQIKQGQTVADISKPYTDAYASVLEQPASQGINDPLVAKALQGTPDQKGTLQATPLWQFEQQLRTDPRWAQTSNAKQAMAQAVTQIGKTFGFMG